MRRPPPTFLTILLVSCGFLLPIEGVIDHVVFASDVTELVLSQAGFGETAYGDGDYGVGVSTSVEPSPTTTIATTTTTSAIVSMPTTEPVGSTTTITTRISASTTTVPTTVDESTTVQTIEQTSTQSQSHFDAVTHPAVVKRRASAFRWVVNPLGTFLDARAEHVPDWVRAIAPQLRVVGFLWLPFVIGFGMWLFLQHQHRIDSSDPKLTEAPLFEDEVVHFEDAAGDGG
jgi:hypothetical protein